MTHDDDSWLRETLKSTDRHIDDDGFADRVTARLPPPRGRASRRRLVALVGGATAAGVVSLGVTPIRLALTDLLLPMPGGSFAELPWFGLTMLALLAWSMVMSSAPES